MRAARARLLVEFCGQRDRRRYQAPAAPHDLRREGSRLVTQAEMPKRIWSHPGEILGGSSRFRAMGAQTGVAPGVAVTHACLCAPSRFDSERSHEEETMKTTIKLKRTATSSSSGSWQKGYAPDF